MPEKIKYKLKAFVGKRQMYRRIATAVRNAHNNCRKSSCPGGKIQGNLNTPILKTACNDSASELATATVRLDCTTDVPLDDFTTNS